MKDKKFNSFLDYISFYYLNGQIDPKDKTYSKYIRYAKKLEFIIE